VVLSDDSIIYTAEEREELSEITRMVRDPSNRLARVSWDVNSPLWNYQWRPQTKFDNLPQTVPCNEQLRTGKGTRIMIYSAVHSYMQKPEVNPDTTAWRRLLIPSAGWINVAPDEGKNYTCEPIDFAGNDILITGMSNDGRFARVHALDNREGNSWADTFFTPNGRLLVHKFTSGSYRKLAGGVDAFFPFMKAYPDYWIETRLIEFFPSLPFTLDDGRIIENYELLGDLTYGLTKNEKVLLYSPSTKYTTNWGMVNHPVPPMG